MKDLRLSPRLLLFLVVLGCLCITASTYAGPVAYINASGTITVINHPRAVDAVSALSLLSSPPPGTHVAMGITSAIPPGTKLLDLTFEGNTAIVNFSKRLMSQGAGEARLAAIFDQVRWTLRCYGIDGDVSILAEGVPFAEYAEPTPVIEPRSSISLNTLSGKSVTLSPGHGLVWTGSSWGFQRSPTCGGQLSREDDHNVEICQYIKTYLEQDGMTVKVPRCLDKNYGTCPLVSYPWWQMCSVYWLWHKGYPCSVWGSTTDCTPGSGADEWNDDIRARPLASDYDNTDIYISIHTNAYQGDCYGTSCPTGSDMYYDCSTEHASWCTVSQNLANAINNALIDAIRNKIPDSDWNNRGVHDSNGAYGEIRIPDRAACLLELGFHDTCDHDVQHLKDNFFRSAAAWGIYKGVCDYFGQTPTWDFYSDELVSHNIPSSMLPGEQANVQIVFRNRGVLWNQARGFKLGAVGDSDPFTSTIRYDVTSEVPPGSTYTFNLTLTAPTTTGTYTTDWRMLREGYQWFGTTCQQQITVSGTPDTTPPSVPTNLSAWPPNQTRVDLTWSASTDNRAVAGYKVYRNGSQIATTANTSYSDTTCTANTTYTYQVSAYDTSGNESAKSSAVVVTTPPNYQVILDEESCTWYGSWTSATATPPAAYNGDYKYTTTSTSSETAWAKWTPNLTYAGTYEVYVYYRSGTNRTTKAPYTVYFKTGSVTIQVNQTVNGGQWNKIATKPFDSGTSGYVKLGNYTGESGLALIADAVRWNYLTYLDSQAPSTPTNLQGTAVSGTQVNLTWTGSTDNIGVAGYKIYRNGSQIGTSATTSYSDTTCTSNTTYTYRVSAYDEAGNESGLSNQVVVTTPARTEYIIDEEAATYQGSWPTSTCDPSLAYNGDYRYYGTATSETAWAKWTPNLEAAANYNVYCMYRSGSNRSTKAPYTVYWNGGSQTVQVNQTTNGGIWVTLVTGKPFAAGTSGYVKLGNGTAESSKVVIADAVKFNKQ
ncbi:MAG: N-acetylmuramoyl-L-alanine amidase [Armatimonadota bacterium]|nr:N-acetylmuramoyl-L-alanine amidase [Armatimonadota bacterium]